MTECDQYVLERQHLLRDLKSTVEALLITQVANLWSIYGGLNRLFNSVEKIFQHGSKGSDNDDTSYYKFIHGLEWLQPSSSKIYFSVDCEYKPHLPAHLKSSKASTWLYCTIETHSLSQKLSWLLSDKSHLEDCYYSFAFLCQEDYAEATLICLRAVERNQPSLLSEVNPRLFVLKNTAVDYHKVHRRCSSFPDSHLKTIMEDRKRSKTISCISDTLKSNPSSKEKESKCEIKNIPCKLKPWHSMPHLLADNLNVKSSKTYFTQSKTTPSTPVHSKKITRISPSVLDVDYEDLLEKKHRRSNLRRSLLHHKPKSEVKHIIIDNCDIIEHTPSNISRDSLAVPLEESGCFASCGSVTSGSKSPNQMAHSPMSRIHFLPISGQKDYNRKPKKSFIEDGGMSVLPAATGYFPRPTKGQSLLSFLTSSHFSRANAELDRENAHFNVAEAIISAMEQIRCQRDEYLADERFDDSDPEIIDLKQRIRLRRRQKFVEKNKKCLLSSSTSDGKTDTATSVSPRSSSSDTLSASMTSDDVDDMEIDEASNLSDNRGLSMSMASLYSEADLLQRPRGAPDGASDILSAEGVALSLISRFSEKQLPKASDLEWLVSEKDAPQTLLPLPKSWPVSPDDSDESPTPLRGTQEWAPPRPQIIFTLHSVIPRKKLMESQHYRCAGCSMKVSPQYASKFRYCNYLGRYFCTGCHTNQISVIPARIIQKWDFSRYPVANFSYRLLEQMYSDPLFRVFDLNKSIGKRSSNLLFCRKYRLGLYYLKDYILNCRFAVSIKERVESEIPHVLSDPDVYSLDDLVRIRNGEMKKQLQALVDLCCRHTSECNLCMARGYICEICRKDDVIFPWQLSRVVRCPKCLTCYHALCWDPSIACIRCTRLSKRRESMESTSRS